VRITKETYLFQKSVAEIFKLLSALLLLFFFAHHTQRDQKKLLGYFQQKRLLPFYFTKLLKEAISKLLASKGRIPQHLYTCMDSKQQRMSMGLKKTSGAHGKT
jgi:hypothetical protein